MERKRFGRGGLLFGAAVAIGVLAYGAFAGRVSGDSAAEPARAVAAAPASARALGGHDHHPAPRAVAEREAVVPADRYARYPRIASVYRMAAEIPEVLDGVHCYCDCAEHAGHYSLLSCFASDHGAMCDICMNEAETAFRLTREGRDLSAVRDAVDRAYGG